MKRQTTQRPKHLAFFDANTSQTFCIILPKVISPEFLMDVISKLGYEHVGLLAGCKNRQAAVRQFERLLACYGHLGDMEPTPLTLSDLN